jgi:hypothetical protein
MSIFPKLWVAPCSRSIRHPNKGRRNFRASRIVHLQQSTSTTTSHAKHHDINRNGSLQICTPRRIARINVNTYAQHRLPRLWLYNPRQSGRPRQQRHTLQEDTLAHHQHILVQLGIHILHGCSPFSQRHHPRPHHTHNPPSSHPRHPRPRPHRHPSPPRALFSHHPPARHPRHRDRQGQGE